jgi:hypothetical protein
MAWNKKSIDRTTPMTISFFMSPPRTLLGTVFHARISFFELIEYFQMIHLFYHLLS